MGELAKDDLLRSWKEISVYLGCDVRTCHRWEAQHGMPVHRAEGSGKRSPVFAYKSELDAWFRGTFTSTKNGRGAADAAGRPWLLWAAGGTLFLVLAGILLVLGPGRARRQPADFSIDGSFFIALDRHKRELWRKDTGAENLSPESEYRNNFQVRHPGETAGLPWLIMKDINADGDNEVLFVLKRTTAQMDEGLLTCYDRTGERIWKFRCERELVCPKKRFSPDYRISGIDVHDLDKDGRLEVFVESIQAPDWPSQLAVLDASGKAIGEFWNAGHLGPLAYRDITGDGREELIVGGTNNEYKGGCLIVFDTRDISGGSPQSGDFACGGIGPGSMLFYLTFPFADVPRALGHVVEGITHLELTGNNWIQAKTFTGLIFDLDLGLRCVQASWGNSYISSHQEGVQAGKISSVLGDAYREYLREAIRYWNGSVWTAEPTMVRR